MNTYFHKWPFKDWACPLKLMLVECIIKTNCWINQNEHRWLAACISAPPFLTWIFPHSLKWGDCLKNDKIGLSLYSGYRSKPSKKCNVYLIFGERVLKLSVCPCSGALELFQAWHGNWSLLCSASQHAVYLTLTVLDQEWSMRRLSLTFTSYLYFNTEVIVIANKCLSLAFFTAVL